MQNKSLNELIKQYPYILDFLSSQNLPKPNNYDMTLFEYFESLSDENYDKLGIDINGLYMLLKKFIEDVESLFENKLEQKINSITIIAGTNKSGEKENFERLEIKPSKIFSIVGPTGSGKSRLLADIEWTAQKDTPTKRQILINDELPDTNWRISSNNKLVAQLSQNMNFIMDLTVREFLECHAQSRMVSDVNEKINEIIQAANELAGEKFSLDTNLTSLSGGQSRALMIADTAILSTAPIVLIDEIENAGIDRNKALSLLVKKDKIVLIATHDPLLALMADYRIVISNGGIKNVIKTSDEEKQLLTKLQKYDEKMQKIRNSLRYGEKLKDIM